MLGVGGGGGGGKPGGGLVPATGVLLGEELEAVPVVSVYQAENWL